MAQELYELPEGWISTKLTDVVDFIGGSQPPKSTFSDTKEEGYVRLVQIRDYKSDKHIVYIDASSTKKTCTKSDVMIGRYGPPVFQILRGIAGAYNVALMKAVPDKDKLSNDYLFTFLQSPRIQEYIIGLSQRAAGQSGVNKKALEAYNIPVPPLAEQARIVSRLDKLFSRIDQAIVQLKHTHTQTKSLFASVQKMMVADVKDGWINKCLNDLGAFSGGGTPSKSNSAFWGGEIPWITPKDMKRATCSALIPVEK